LNNFEGKVRGEDWRRKKGGIHENRQTAGCEKEGDDYRKEVRGSRKAKGRRGLGTNTRQVGGRSALNHD